MTTVQIWLTSVFYLWLFGMLILLVLIWRDTGNRQRHLQQALIDIANKSAQAAERAADTCAKLAARLEEK